MAQLAYKDHRKASEVTEHILSYPGTYATPLDATNSCRPNAVDGTWSAELIPVRELQMMALMNSLSDKPEWTRKIYDEDVVAHWRAEAKAMPASLIEDEQFDYCLSELKFEANQLEMLGVCSALDSEAMVVKSDCLIEPLLHKRICAAYQQLATTLPVDFHPRSNQRARNLIHPSLYPLVFARSRFRTDFESSSPIDSLSNFSGAGLVLEEPLDPDIETLDMTSELVSAYSTDFQWLPCTLLRQDGRFKITSPVNGVHPRRAPAVYAVIEQAINACIPAWERCLLECTRRMNGQDYKWIKIASPPSSDEGSYDPDYDYANNYRLTHPVNCKSLEDRKASQIAKPSLGEQASKLQVIVKMVSIDLTPDNPSSPQGGWHLEGQLNEHIVATALYYFDCENVSHSSLAFRECVTGEDDHVNGQYQYEQNEYAHWEQIFGVNLTDGERLQEIGQVETRVGRVVAFPNYLQHRVSSFELADKSKPGYRRFIALWLVDPEAPILSTSNIGPQQIDWWAAETLRRYHDLPKTRHRLLEEVLYTNAKVRRLPAEIFGMILAQLQDWLITTDEAKNIRLNLMDERTFANNQLNDEYASKGFSFCEH